MNAYQYQPLAGQRSFRILKLSRAILPGDPLHGELVHAELDSCPAYEALSYTWESQSPSVIIYVHGCHLLVTDNCEKALRRMLRGPSTRPMWIDSVCINQSSIQERNHQVRLMGDIYRRAYRVNVWLGSATEESDTAMWALKKLAVVTTLNILLPSLFKTWAQKRRQKLVDTLLGKLCY